MLANPSVAARVVGIDDHIFGVTTSVGGGSLPVVGLDKAVRRHDLWKAVGPRKHKRVGHFVVAWTKEREDFATATVTALIVVVVDEDERISVGYHAPAGAEVLQIAQLLTVSLSDNLFILFFFRGLLASTRYL